MVVELIADGNRVAVELNETVDDGDARLHTDETVVFDVRDGLDRAGRGVPADVGTPTAGVGMTEPVCELDLARMRRDRIAKLDAAMEAAAVDVLVAVRATERRRTRRARACRPPITCARRGGVRSRCSSGVRRGRTSTPTSPKARRRSARRVPAPRDRGRDRGGRGRARRASSAAGRLAIDDAPFPLWDALRDARASSTRARCTGPAKLTKTPDELECIRQAQAINEDAMRIVRPLAVPGALATELSGAFLRAVAELGATANTVDPVFQVMPAVGGATVRSASPASRCSRSRPAPTSCKLGDVMWIDTGINLHGYASDFGATWIIGRDAEPPSSTTSSRGGAPSSTARWHR